jgi:hypothetical protein
MAAMEEDFKTVHSIYPEAFVARHVSKRGKVYFWVQSDSGGIPLCHAFLDTVLVDAKVQAWSAAAEYVRNMIL